MTTMTEQQLRDDVERREPQLLSDETLGFEPDWENEPERASLQRDYRRLSGGYAFTPDDLAYIAGLPSHLGVPYFAHAVKWFDVSVALEGAHRMEINSSHREFLTYMIQQCAEEARADYEAEAAVELLSPDDLTDEQREHCEAAADIFRDAGYHVRVGVWSGNPFAAWAKRQLASIKTALNIEDYQWGRTLDAINALPETDASERLCGSCGNAFKPTRSDALFCSNRCRQQNYRESKKKP